MSWWDSPIGQFVRVVAAQAVAAALNAAAANLGIFHLALVYVTALGALIHALDEYVTTRLMLPGR